MFLPAPAFCRRIGVVLERQQDQRDMPQAPTAPSISVLMPAYNASAFIRQSVQSVLAQTYEDFELLVVNDGSTDDTRDILARIDDPRIRVLDNGANRGVVASRNRAMSEARGQYIAIHDADDISMPGRFLRQKMFLDEHPGIAAVCAQQSVTEKGAIRFIRPKADTDPSVVRAMLHFSNPVGHSSVMFRRSAADHLSEYQREAYSYAEDFDFLHRLLTVGEICELEDFLVIYRRHDGNISTIRRKTMLELTAKVLGEAYDRLLGEPCLAEANLVAQHMLAQEPFSDVDDMERTGRFLDRLIEALIRRHVLSNEQADKVMHFAARRWWGVLQASLRKGKVVDAMRQHTAFSGASRYRPSLREIARATASGLVPQLVRGSRPGPAVPPAMPPALSINGAPFRPVPIPDDDPPTLYIVIDTEAEFDWNKGFDRSLTAVSAMRHQTPAQSIFDAWGARPVYVVDYPIASQPEGYEPLREILNRHGCVIGAHMHAWVTPPFEEALSEYNSFGGNLPRDLEERKLRALVAMIERSFGITPLFFRAGRYGVGPNTMDLLGELGFQVDFSLLPHADLRARGGPDFRFAECVPYRAGTGEILSVPMTRGQIGALAPMSPVLQGLLQHRLAERLRLPGILARLHLANTVTLTPEGVSAEEQVRLIDAMMARGCRTFALHYHSPSLAKQTPYVRTEAELAEFIHRIDTVCRHFFQVRGGLPGNPADLLPQHMRSRLWPETAKVPVAAQ